MQDDGDWLVVARCSLLEDEEGHALVAFRGKGQELLPVTVLDAELAG